MNDFWDFVLFAFVWILVIFMVSIIPIGCYYDVKQQEQIKECFMQEVKTKECEYKLYQYEHRNTNRTIVVPTPIVVK